MSETKIIREALCALLRTEFRDFSICPHANLQEATEDKCFVDASIVIVDQPCSDSQTLITELRSQACHAKIIVLLHDFNQDFIFFCVGLGVEGFLLNHEGSEAFTACVRDVKNDQLHYPSRVTRLLLARFNKPSVSAQIKPQDTPNQHNLTCRQIHVIKLIDQGMSNKLIARSLNIELATVKNHVHQIIEKLGVSNRYEAAARYRSEHHEHDEHAYGTTADPQPLMNR